MRGVKAINVSIAGPSLRQTVPGKAPKHLFTSWLVAGKTKQKKKRKKANRKNRKAPLLVGGKKRSREPAKLSASAQY